MYYYKQTEIQMLMYAYLCITSQNDNFNRKAEDKPLSESPP